MEFLDTVIGAAVVLLGFLVGRLTRRRKVPKRPDPICSCSHARAFHIEGKGSCQEREFLGSPRYEWVSCKCQIYDGPEPLPAYYAPEITS